MESSTKKNSIELGFQAFVLGLYSVVLIVSGLSIVTLKLIEIGLLLLNLSDILTIVLWASLGIFLAGYLMLIIMGISLGLGKYNYGIGAFGFAVLFVGIYDTAIIVIQYLIGVDLISMIAPLVAGILEFAIGAMAIKSAKNLSEEALKQYIILTALVFSLIITKAIIPIFSELGNLDYLSILYLIVFNSLVLSTHDLILMSIGGILSPVVAISTLVGLVLATRRGGFRYSYGAKLSLAFSAIIGILGVFISSLYLSLGFSLAILVGFLTTHIELTRVLSNAFTTFIISVEIVMFLGLIALSAYAFSNYYVVVSPTQRGPSIEEAIEEVTVVERAEEREERREELMEGLEELEELEFEEFEI